MKSDVAPRTMGASEEKRMSEEDRRMEAEARLAEALKRGEVQDPRGYLRERMRELKRSKPDAYEEAAGYYGDTLVPSIASGEADPILAWREFAKRIAELTAAGETVVIGPTGEAAPYSEETPKDRLVLHLPESRSWKALVVSMPAEPSPAQRATHELLVLGARAGGSR